MPVCAVPLPAEVKAHDAILKHSRSCRICQAKGHDLCRTYLRLFRKWEEAQKAQ